jgi:hypothetical protein
MYAPAEVVDGTAIDNVDVSSSPEAIVSEDGLRVASKPDGADAVSETVPLNPLRDATLIEETPEAPAMIVKAEGDAEMEKSGVFVGT